MLWSAAFSAAWAVCNDNYYLFFLWIFTCSYLKVIYMERWLKQQLCQFVGFKLEGKSSEMICHHVGSPSLGHVRIFYFKENVYFCLLLPPSKIGTNLRNMVKVWRLLYHTLSWCSCPQTGRNPWILVSFRKSQPVWFDCLLKRQGQERFWLTKLWCQAKLSLHNWRMLLDTSKVTFWTPLKVPTKISHTNWGQHDPTTG